jgi:hypothetical protein
MTAWQRQFLVDRFSQFPRVDTGHFVEIKKHLLEAELIRSLNVVADLLIEARMADENGRHLLLPDRNLDLSNQQHVPLHGLAVPTSISIRLVGRTSAIGGTNRTSRLDVCY